MYIHGRSAVIIQTYTVTLQLREPRKPSRLIMPAHSTSVAFFVFWIWYNDPTNA